ncbi:hypothetical protein [Thermoflavifilum thermophilum]|uniref:hypothetical protein n=1 Tax=Thermoflavifilum thermophilum TaxID=1393122 RepID=UPI000B8101BD|nr:hypothetical protein [Thermoflavifilum thermophilum]
MVKYFDDHLPKDPNWKPVLKNLKEYKRSTIPKAVIRAIQGKEYQKYDAIPIDDGPDYYYEWYWMLDKYFLTDHDEVLIVCDKRQNIFDRELDWLEKRVTLTGLEKFRETIFTLQ